MMSTIFTCGVRVALFSTIATSLAAPVPAHAQPALTHVQAAQAQAVAAFNGLWSVLIITNRGPCDRAYRYPVRISNGHVTYAGQADFRAGGRVAPNGAVSVSVSRGSQSASGSGRLVAGSGSGTWSGFGESSCSGTWTAEKRG
jgi:hypothetical protein